MRYLSESSLLFQRSLLRIFLSGWTVLLTFGRIGLHVNSFPSTFRITRSSGFLYHRFNWERDWREPHASRQNVSGSVHVTIQRNPACWAFQRSVLFGYSRHARPTHRTLCRSPMRTNINNRQTFPTGFVLDLTLQFRKRPRVHSPSVEMSLTVAFPV